MLDGQRFPAVVYAETVLSVNFRDAQRLFLNSLIEIHYAHTLMLARQGIISPSAARACVHGLDELNRTELSSVPYDGCSEDLFFFVEDALAQFCGRTIAGVL